MGIEKAALWASKARWIALDVVRGDDLRRILDEADVWTRLGWLLAWLRVNVESNGGY